MKPVIRPERASDEALIADVIRQAFLDHPHSSHTEHFIVAALRREGALTLSLVAEQAGDVVGHVALSPVTVSDGEDGWFGLGPVAVLPSWQGRGIGHALVEEGLARLRAKGAAGCVLLGEPAYYGRFGFKYDPRLVLPGVPPSFFLSLAFGPCVPQGEVSYHAAFEARD